MIAPMRKPQAFHTLLAVSRLIRRPSIPGTSLSVNAQILDVSLPFRKPIRDTLRQNNPQIMFNT